MQHLAKVIRKESGRFIRFLAACIIKSVYFPGVIALAHIYCQGVGVGARKLF